VVGTSEASSVEEEGIMKVVEGGSSKEIDKTSPSPKMGILEEGYTLTTLDHPTERPPTPALTPPPAVGSMLPDCPPVSALFDDKLLGDTTDMDVQVLNEGPEPALFDDQPPQDMADNVQMTIVDAQLLALTEVVPEKGPEPEPPSPMSPPLEIEKPASHPPSPSSLLLI